MNLFLASLLLLLPIQSQNESVGTLPVIRHVNPAYAPISVQHGDVITAGDLGYEDLVAGNEVELTDEWKWNGVLHKVKTVKRQNESDADHAKRHQKAVLVNLEVFPPDLPQTQG